ncbi:DUF2268 domain-containing putative Zn-dependent protease [Halobacillus halophilus]|uniref:DUF2268 domain-containing putative Zn-dependent protease n=1 Tax=Halobacillus halophilus TaxID=1570 RepID=UPI001CD7FB03|nr:DUF2268 domain-containing putative Zn-dependent protease [Halobacillus halophilus]MCA1011819.1 DUF2268 domain-containing protein [Halobacillus halophilus]
MRYLIIFGLALLAISIGCEQETSNKLNNQKTDASTQAEKMSNQDEYIIENTIEEGQTLRVFSAYEYVEEYVKKAEETVEQSDRQKLWKTIVMDRVQDACLRGEYSHLVKEYVNIPPRELKEVKDDITMMQASELEKTVLQALEKSADTLPGEDTTVCLLPQGEMSFPGVTVGAGKISLFNVASVSKDRLKHIVAHEYHHSTWTADYSLNDEEWDLLGSIVFEGKAEYFGSLLYGTPPTEVKSRMGKEQEKALWKQAKSLLDSNDASRVNRVLYGEKGEYPPGFGYMAGYHIVEKYVENHPESSIEEWTKTPPEQLYRESGYEESF